MRHLLDTDGFIQKAVRMRSGLLRSEAGRVRTILQRQETMLPEEWQQDGIRRTLLACRPLHAYRNT